MMRRNLALGLVLILGVACEKKSSSEEEFTAGEATAVQGVDEGSVKADPEAAAEEPGTPADFLLGKWASDCINQPGNLQASIVFQYEFAAEGSASSKIISYAGADCTRRFTKADVDVLIAQTNAERAAQVPPAAPLNAAELAQLESLWFPAISAFSFKLGRTLKDQTVEMNYSQMLGDETINTYVTIFVAENNLYFAEVCRKQDLDQGSCDQIVGDSVKNRARDMTSATPFRKI